MTLAEKLSTYDEKYWDFSEYRNDAPLVRYPAVMVAPMQACILKEIINADPTTSTVLDPFCGSGTVLCEGQKLGLNVMGFDINPMAVLIATVQLEGIPEDCAVRSINAINTRLTMLNGNVKSYAFKNINKCATQFSQHLRNTSTKSCHTLFTDIESADKLYPISTAFSI